jgi:ubiquinone biosynthesis protein COQ9
MAEIRRRCPTRLDLLRLHGRVMDTTVLETGVPGQTGAPRDQVFDVLMRRIDAMQPHRAGLLRFFDDIRDDPLLGLLLLAELPVSMAWMLEAAGLSPRGLGGLIRVKGLTGVWLATVRAWARDDKPDLGATMAALDRALDQAERIARSLYLSAGETRSDDTVA